jgi:hypothetical protein
MNIITIKNCSEPSAKKALDSWIDLYQESLESHLTFKLFKQSDESFLVEVDQKLDNERFFYLVNFLQLSEGIEQQGQVEGFTISEYSSKLKGKNILVYFDKGCEFDTVKISTDKAEYFLYDFGGNLTSIKQGKTCLTPLLSLGTELSSRTTSRAKKNKAIKKYKDAVLKRFIIIWSLIWIASILLIYHSPFDLQKPDIKFWIAFSIVIWLFSDYKVLQSFKRQLVSFCLVLLLYQYVFLENLDELLSSTDAVLLLPISLLVVQLPLRLAFKAMFKREPVIDKSSPSFLDFIYTMILLLGAMAFMFIW